MNYALRYTSKLLRSILNRDLKYRYKADRINKRPVFITVLEGTVLLRLRQYFRLLSLSECNIRDQIIHSLDKQLLEISNFILGQLSYISTLNYVPRKTHSYIFGNQKRFMHDISFIKSVYPDDIDDTFSALYLLSLISPHSIHTNRIAIILTELEKIRNPVNKHLFNTWYSRYPIWKNTDYTALSSVVAFFDSIHNPCTELKKEVFNATFRGVYSDFYTSYEISLYLLSRCTIPSTHRGSFFIKCTKSLHNNTSFNSQLATSAWIWTIIGSNTHTDTSSKNEIINAYETISKLKHTTLYHTPHAGTFDLYTERLSRNNHISYARSKIFEKLVTIECIVAQYLLKHAYHQTIYTYKNKSRLRLGTSSKHRLSTGQIRDIVLDSYSEFDIDVFTKNILRAKLNTILNSVDFRIVRDILYTYIDVQQSLSASTTHRIINNRRTPPATLLTLHTQGLLTYNILDKVIDGDIPPILFSLASTLVYHFYNNLNKYNFGKIPSHICNQIHNYYILSNSSYFSRVRLSDCWQKSIGTALFPIIQYPIFARQFMYFFKNFQHARQLLDDMKDLPYDDVVGKQSSLTQENPLNSHVLTLPYALCISHNTLYQSYKMTLKDKDLPNNIREVLKRYTEQYLEITTQRIYELNLLYELRKINPHPTTITNLSLAP